jgi:hypothetical protein
VQSGQVGVPFSLAERVSYTISVPQRGQAVPVGSGSINPYRRPFERPSSLAIEFTLRAELQ